MYWKLKLHLNKLSSRAAKKGTCWSISSSTYYIYVIRAITCINFFLIFAHNIPGTENHVNYNCQWGGIIRILRRGGGVQVNFYCDTCTIKIFRWKCNRLFHFVKGLFRWTIFQSYTKNHIALLSSSFHNTKYFRFNKSNANRGSFTLLKIQLSCHDVKFYSAFWTLELNLLCIFLTVS